MKSTKIFGGIGVLVLAAIAAFASNPPQNTYWFRNAQGQPESIKVNFTCTPQLTGCLITSGPNVGKQLYTASNLVTTLRH
jgi:hypothetical protein